MPSSAVLDDKPGLQRIGRGQRARYVRAGGKAVRDAAALRRARVVGNSSCEYLVSLT
jgi:hypothetical protein